MQQIFYVRKSRNYDAAKKNSVLQYSVSLFPVVSTSAIDFLERLVSEMTLYCVDPLEWNMKPTNSTQPIEIVY